MGPWCFVSPRFEKQLACKVIALSLLWCLACVLFLLACQQMGLSSPIVSPVLLKISKTIKSSSKLFFQNKMLSVYQAMGYPVVKNPKIQ